MYAKFQLFRVRKLIGKLGVPYNRRLGVRGSSHPLILCRRFITPRSGKQRFPYPAGFGLSRTADRAVNRLVFFGRKPCVDNDSAQLGLGNLWPAHFWLHKNTLCKTKITVDKA